MMCDCPTARRSCVMAAPVVASCGEQVLERNHSQPKEKRLTVGMRVLDGVVPKLYSIVDALAEVRRLRACFREA